ncbi:MAG: hypothetical protein WC655_05720 [Candidatus Hydrogenedentales bacterium]|jgi:hypothetical protein
MYVKIHNQILDGSLANDRKLRHFFMDVLLCSDPDGNVMMTREAISLRIRAPMEEVDWGLAELQKPDGESLSPTHEGRRIIRLEGHGYGWKIVNYEYYRDLKSERQRREDTAERVRRFRERKALAAAGVAVPFKLATKRRRRSPRNLPQAGELEYLEAMDRGASQEELDSIVTKHLPLPPAEQVSVAGPAAGNAEGNPGETLGNGGAA